MSSKEARFPSLLVEFCKGRGTESRPFSSRAALVDKAVPIACQRGKEIPRMQLATAPCPMKVYKILEIMVLDFSFWKFSNCTPQQKIFLV
jgi:hypothetical protein